MMNISWAQSTPFPIFQSFMPLNSLRKSMKTPDVTCLLDSVCHPLPFTPWGLSSSHYHNVSAYLLSLYPPIRALAWVTLDLRKDITLASRLLVPFCARGQEVIPLWALSQTVLYPKGWAQTPPCAEPNLLPQTIDSSRRQRSSRQQSSWRNSWTAQTRPTGMSASTNKSTLGHCVVSQVLSHWAICQDKLFPVTTTLETPTGNL